MINLDPNLNNLEKSELESLQKIVQAELDEHKKLIEKYGSLSWEIFEISEKWRNDEISDSHFRELIRQSVDKNIK